MVNLNSDHERCLINYLETVGLSRKSIMKYTNYYRKFFHIHGILDQKNVDIFLKMNNHSVGKNMIKNLIKSIIRSDFPDAIKQEVRNIDIPFHTGKKQKKIPKFIKRSDIDRLDFGIDTGDYYMDERLRLMILVQFYAGLRVSELIEIRYESLNLGEFDKNKKYHIIRISSESAKFGKERYAYLPTEVMSRLIKWLNVHYIKMESMKRLVENKPVWNIHVNRYKKLLSDWSIRILGESYNTHSLRHGRGTDLILNENRTIEFVKEYIGHADIGSTQIYTHLSNKDIKNELES